MLVESFLLFSIFLDTPCHAFRHPSRLVVSSTVTPTFDPFFFTSQIHDKQSSSDIFSQLGKSSSVQCSDATKAIVYTSALTGWLLVDGTNAAVADPGEQKNIMQIFDPSNFQPVCPASDNIYQGLKITAGSIVGNENIVEFGPLIASVLLRVRLEICVLESFIYEAVIPFIQQKGLSWVLPIHETLETFLAGTIFAVACNVILLGSTKIISIIFIYADVLTGMPTRFIGNVLKKLLPNSSTGDSVGTLLKLYGDIMGGVRGALESIDTFVGRYLVLLTTLYVAFKFAHFKIFNYFP
eukprot:gene1945-3772_t